MPLALRTRGQNLDTSSFVRTIDPQHVAPTKYWFRWNLDSNLRSYNYVLHLFGVIVVSYIYYMSTSFFITFIFSERRTMQKQLDFWRERKLWRPWPSPKQRNRVMLISSSSLWVYQDQERFVEFLWHHNLCCIGPVPTMLKLMVSCLGRLSDSHAQRAKQAVESGTMWFARTSKSKCCHTTTMMLS